MSIPMVRSEVGEGQDNLQVYTQILGLSEEGFIDLMQQGVFE
jgi:hypothetical protein